MKKYLNDSSYKNAQYREFMQEILKRFQSTILKNIFIATQEKAKHLATELQDNQKRNPMFKITPDIVSYAKIMQKEPLLSLISNRRC